MENEKLKKKWKQTWKWELAAQKHQEYMTGKRKGSTSKEFRGYVKEFMRVRRLNDRLRKKKKF